MLIYRASIELARLNINQSLRQSNNHTALNKNSLEQNCSSEQNCSPEQNENHEQCLFAHDT